MTYYDKNALKLAHEYLKENVREGDTVVDATAGKGRDTLLLASLVGEKGKVFSIDIQQTAIDGAKTLISENGLNDRVEFICDSHVNIKKYVPKADGVVFNLGWLPGSDHEIRTSAETSLSAIGAATEVLSSCAYTTGVCRVLKKETRFFRFSNRSIRKSSPSLSHGSRTEKAVRRSLRS